MEIKASLNNLRVSPRKIRLVVNLVRGKSVPQAKTQLSFLTKKPAPLILKLVNSAVANAKKNFGVEKEDNLYIKTIIVEAGASLKRWLPRAMGRATPIMKRTCSVKLVLDEFEPSTKKVRKARKPEVVRPEEVLPAVEQEIKEIVTASEVKPKDIVPQKPYGSTGQAKKRHFARQTFGNIRKMFRRKSI